MILTATKLLVSGTQHLATCPNVPCPRISFTMYLYIDNIKPYITAFAEFIDWQWYTTTTTSPNASPTCERFGRSKRKQIYLCEQNHPQRDIDWQRYICHGNSFYQKKLASLWHNLISQRLKDYRCRQGNWALQIMDKILHAATPIIHQMVSWICDQPQEAKISTHDHEFK